MKHHLTLLALAPLLALSPGCFLAVAGAGAGVGYVVSQKDKVHIAQVERDVDHVWPLVKETVGFYQAPGSDATFQDSPRVVHAKVDGAKVTVEVEALDIDRTTIRVSAEKYLTADEATAAQVMKGILERIDKS